VKGVVGGVEERRRSEGGEEMESGISRSVAVAVVTRIIIKRVRLKDVSMALVYPCYIKHEDAKSISRNLPGRRRYGELASNTRPKEPKASSGPL